MFYALTTLYFETKYRKIPFLFCRQTQIMKSTFPIFKRCVHLQRRNSFFWVLSNLKRFEPKNYSTSYLIFALRLFVDKKNKKNRFVDFCRHTLDIYQHLLYVFKNTSVIAHIFAMLQLSKQTNLSTKILPSSYCQSNGKASRP